MTDIVGLALALRDDLLASRIVLGDDDGQVGAHPRALDVIPRQDRRAGVDLVAGIGLTQLSACVGAAGRAGRLVSTGQLIDELWGDDPPAAARKLVSGYVPQLRRLTGDPAGRISACCEIS